MALKKKQKKNLKVVKRKIVSKKKINSKKVFDNFSENISNIIKIPFQFINIFINHLIKVIKGISIQLFTLIKKITKLLSGAKEAFFSILFGLLAGAIGAVITFSYLDLNTQGINTEYESKILDSEKVISDLTTEVEESNIRFEKYQVLLNQLKSKLDIAEKKNSDNENLISESNNKIIKLSNYTI